MVNIANFNTKLVPWLVSPDSLNEMQMMFCLWIKNSPTLLNVFDTMIKKILVSLKAVLKCIMLETQTYFF